MIRCVRTGILLLLLGLLGCRGPALVPSTRFEDRGSPAMAPEVTLPPEALEESYYPEGSRMRQ